MSEDPSFSARSQQIGKRLSLSRENRRLRISEMAVLLNISPSRYKAYEKGSLSPSLPELEVLAINLNIPITSLLSHEEQILDFLVMDPVQSIKFVQLRQRIIATRLKKVLEDAEIPRSDIATALNIKPKELSNYLSGKKPIPVPVLDGLCRIATIAVQSLYGTHGTVGERLSQAERVAGFKQLPSNLQDFIAQPINRPYVELANRLSNLPVDKLRGIAEGLLDITF
jgi:transcriptional regulator with XRE-family HTH domain